MHFNYRTDLEMNINFFFLSIQRMTNQLQLWFPKLPYNQRRRVVTYLSHWKSLPLFCEKDRPIVGGCAANVIIHESKHYLLENNWFDIIFAAVPEWFAAGAFGLVTVFTLLLRNVPALQSNLLYVIYFILFSFLSSICFPIVELHLDFSSTWRKEYSGTIFQLFLREILKYLILSHTYEGPKCSFLFT